MLEGRKIEYDYREYAEEPLSAVEIKRVLSLLGVGPRAVLRRNDKAFRELGLREGIGSDDELIRLMAKHPTLLQRPIAIRGDRAVVGRPPEQVLELA